MVNEPQARKEIWIALSDLFLDIDVTLSYQYIVRVCAESDYSIDEIKDILENEVAPVCSANLLSVAGEWAGFDEGWQVTEISKRKRKNGRIPWSLFKPLRSLRFRGYIKEHWAEIEKEILKKRKR